MTRYEQGFLTKCAEYGVGTDTAVQLMQKQSGLAKNIAKALGEYGGAAGKLNNLSGRLGSSALAHEVKGHPVKALLEYLAQAGVLGARKASLKTSRLFSKLDRGW